MDKTTNKRAKRRTTRRNPAEEVMSATKAQIAPALAVVGGGLGAKILTRAVQSALANPSATLTGIVRIAVPLVGAGITSSIGNRTKKQMLQNAAVGMAGEALVNGVRFVLGAKASSFLNDDEPVYAATQPVYYTEPTYVPTFTTPSLSDGGAYLDSQLLEGEPAPEPEQLIAVTGLSGDGYFREAYPNGGY